MGKKRAAPKADAPEFNRAVAQRLSDLMDERGVTPAALAETLGVSRAAVGHWTTCRSDVPWALLPKIAAALQLKKIRDLIPTEFDPPGGAP